jgi:hypothetical protein
MHLYDSYANICNEWAMNFDPEPNANTTKKMLKLPAGIKYFDASVFSDRQRTNMRKFCLKKLSNGAVIAQSNLRGTL